MAPLSGWFPFLPDDGFGESEAGEWIRLMHVSLNSIFRFCAFGILPASGILTTLGLTSLVSEANNIVNALKLYDVQNRGFSLVHMSGAWDGIQVQVGK